MAEYEEKFIVINKKVLQELTDHHSEIRERVKIDPTVNRFLTALEDLCGMYEIVFGKKLDQKYYVVNQDEPYADDVIKIILDNETAKDGE